MKAIIGLRTSIWIPGPTLWAACSALAEWEGRDGTLPLPSKDRQGSKQRCLLAEWPRAADKYIVRKEIHPGGPVPAGPE